MPGTILKMSFLLIYYIPISCEAEIQIHGRTLGMWKKAGITLWEPEKWVERSCSSWILVGTRTATRPMPQWFFGILKAHWFTPRQGYSGMNLKGPTLWMIEWCYTCLGSGVISRAHGASQVLMLHCSTKTAQKQLCQPFGYRELARWSWWAEGCWPQHRHGSIFCVSWFAWDASNVSLGHCDHRFRQREGPQDTAGTALFPSWSPTSLSVRCERIPSTWDCRTRDVYTWPKWIMTASTFVMMMATTLRPNVDSLSLWRWTSSFLNFSNHVASCSHVFSSSSTAKLSGQRRSIPGLQIVSVHGWWFCLSQMFAAEQIWWLMLSGFRREGCLFELIKLLVDRNIPCRSIYQRFSTACTIYVFCHISCWTKVLFRRGLSSTQMRPFCHYQKRSEGNSLNLLTPKVDFCQKSRPRSHGSLWSMEMARFSWMHRFLVKTHEDCNDKAQCSCSSCSTLAALCRWCFYVFFNVFHAFIVCTSLLFFMVRLKSCFWREISKRCSRRVAE